MKYVEEGLEVDLVLKEDGTYLEFEWRDVVGYEGYYLVSNYAHVKTVGRKFINSQGRTTTVKSRILQLHDTGSGYKRIMTESKHSGTLNSVVHRLVAKAFIKDFNSDLEVDHIDRDPSNNTVLNLRMATSSQNNANTKVIKGTSKYKGVHQEGRTQKWVAQIRWERTAIWIGSYLIEENAARAYNIKALELCGEFAFLNDVEGEMEPEVYVRKPSRVRPVKCLSTGVEFKSLASAARITGLSPSTIERSCRLSIPTYNGLNFSFIDG